MHRPIAFALVAGLLSASAAGGGRVARSENEGKKEGVARMAEMFQSRTLSVSIDRPPRVVYAFASDPENIPKWAAGLGKTVRKQVTEWIVETPQGPMRLRFAERNDFGVLDHHVTTPSGTELYVPMRVVSNGAGSEVLFTLFRLPDVSDDRYIEDMRQVERDLRTLKDLLEE